MAAGLGTGVRNGFLVTGRPSGRSPTTRHTRIPLQSLGPAVVFVFHVEITAALVARGFGRRRAFIFRSRI